MCKGYEALVYIMLMEAKCHVCVEETPWQWESLHLHRRALKDSQSCSIKIINHKQSNHELRIYKVINL